MLAALKHHWPEYLMEAAGLGLFMLSACVFATLLEHPASPVRQAISDPIQRRILMGLAMGLTAVSLVYSPCPALCRGAMHRWGAWGTMRRDAPRARAS